MAFCVSLIGMPGAGKSTIGLLVADLLQYAFVDTDYIMESLYGRSLQEVTEALGVEEFRDAEACAIRAITGCDSVIATGGSAIYRPSAMEHLRSLGPVVHLHLSLGAVARRVALNPARGISFGPGQSLADLYAERQNLYAAYADMVCNTEDHTSSECAALIGKYVLDWSGRGIA